MSCQETGGDSSVSCRADDEHRVIRNSGRTSDNLQALIHPIGLGTYLLDRDKIHSVLQTAIRSGYRRIDCAPVYFNEDAVGDALEAILNSNNYSNTNKDDNDYHAIHGSVGNSQQDDEGAAVRREDLFIVSKLPSPFHHNPEIALRKTLRDLKLDYLDLYLIHWPVAFKPIQFDPNIRGWENEDLDDSNNGSNIDMTISIHDTWSKMEALVRKGLVRHIGVSNFPVMLLHELMTKASIVPLVNQCECHPYLQQLQLIRYCSIRGVHFQSYSPLGASDETRTAHDPVLLHDPVLQQIANKHNTSTASICLAWALQRFDHANTIDSVAMPPKTRITTSVVVKSNNKKHIRDNILELKSIQLSPEDIALIETLDRNHRYFRPEEWWQDMPLAVFH